MNAHDTPSGTRMMWKASVNAICARAHGTGSTARIGCSESQDASHRVNHRAVAHSVHLRLEPFLDLQHSAT